MNIAQSFTTLIKRIETQEVSPLYFFYGAESYYIEKLIKVIEKKVVDPETFDFNYDHFRCDEVDSTLIINAASAFPMMTDKRLVLVEAVQKLSKSSRDKLQNYISSPVSSTCLVLVAEKVDMRVKFYNTLKKNAVCFESKPLYIGQAATWVREHFRNQNISISAETATFIVDQTGPSLWNLYNEAEKIITGLWGKKTLVRSDIAEIVGFSRDCTGWEFTDCLGRRELDKSLSILEKLLGSSASIAVYLITLIYQRIILLLKIVTLKNSGQSKTQINSILRLPGFFAENYHKQAAGYSMSELKRSIRILVKADLYLKTGYMDSKLLLTVLTYEIIADQAKTKLRSIFL